MDSLVFAFNAVAPIIGLVVIGYLLKRVGLMSENFSVAANKLVFRVFLPVMLFYNIYRITDLSAIEPAYIFYALSVIFALFVISAIAVRAVTPKRERHGVLIQGTFRSNYALIGVPLAEALFGTEGAVIASVLAAIVVPFLNVLAVVALSAFGSRDGRRPSVKKILLDIAKNPLICGVAAGFAVLFVRFLFERFGIGFRLTDVQPVEKLLSYLSGLATPVALLALGARFEFSAVASLRREIIFGTVMRTVLAPLLGIGFAFLFLRGVFTGAHFAVFVAIFATPVAVSSVPMTQEMGGDSALAGQLVVWTTLVSGFSIFIAAFLLRLAGVF